MATTTRPPSTEPNRFREEDLRVPIPLAAGHYELLTTEELDDHFTDLLHEYARRNREVPALG